MLKCARIKRPDNAPLGLTDKDSLVDCLSRADSLSDPQGCRYSGIMLHNKDLRRIVLLAREYRRVLALLDKQLVKDMSDE